MTDTLQRVLRANEPLTLAGVPSGFLPWLAADLARAAMVRTPMQASQFLIWKHGCQIGLFAPDCEHRHRR